LREERRGYVPSVASEEQSLSEMLDNCRRMLTVARTEHPAVPASIIEAMEHACTELTARLKELRGVRSAPARPAAERTPT
jgi:hypothetical protein